MNPRARRIRRLRRKWTFDKPAGIWLTRRIGVICGLKEMKKPRVSVTKIGRVAP